MIDSTGHPEAIAQGECTSAMAITEASDFLESSSGAGNADKDRRAFSRWSISAAIVLIAHGLVGALVLRWQATASAIEPTATIVIELSPVLAAPNVQEVETPPVPQQVQAKNSPEKAADNEPEEKVEAEQDRTARAETAPVPPSRLIEETEAERSEPPLQKVETVETGAKSDVELAPLPKEIDNKRTDVPRSEPENLKRHEQTAQPKPVKPAPNKPQKRAPPLAATRPQVAQAHEAVTTQAPAVSAPNNSNALPSWKSQVIGILERNKRYPLEAQARQEHGTSNLAFSLNRQGRVTSARIAASSGSSALDAETLSLVHRVQPFPPPPPEIAGAQISLVVAIRYNSR